MMSICNRLECNDNYAETSESSWTSGDVFKGCTAADQMNQIKGFRFTKFWEAEKVT